MTWLQVRFGKGAVEACIGRDYMAWEYGHEVDADFVVGEYQARCHIVAERNPDMTPAQVHDFVLDQWLKEKEEEQERRSHE